MSEFEFYLTTLQVLEKIGARYMVVGAYGASAYGVSRNTHDVDIIVDLDATACEKLAAYFPAPRYYADPDQMRASIRAGLMFNIIDSSLGIKADLIPLSHEAEYRQAFAQRSRCMVIDPQGNEFEIWCARPEDIIIGKLAAWQEGRSDKHPADIYAMLVFLLSGLAEHDLDAGYVTDFVARLGSECAALWQKLLIRAQAETKNRPPLAETDF